MATQSDDEYIAVEENVKHTELIIVGDIVDNNDYLLIDKNSRRAHICCGCDTRNASIAVNIVSICIYIFGIISFSLVAGDKQNYNDDQVQNVMDALQNAKVTVMISTFTTGSICNMIAIYGAVSFNRFLVMIGASWFVFVTILSLCYADITFAVMSMGFFYPHFVFYYELKNGIMNKENYPTEKACCDCCCTL